MGAMLVSQTNSVGIESFSYPKSFSLVPLNLHGCWRRKWSRSIYTYFNKGCFVTGESPVSYWPILFSVPSNSPRHLSKCTITCQLTFLPIRFSVFGKEHGSLLGITYREIPIVALMFNHNQLIPDS